LDGVLLAVVVADPAAGDAGTSVAAVLRGEGATVKACVANANALATLSAPGFDAVVLETNDEPERFVALATTLAGDPRMRGVPTIAVVDGAATASRLAKLGAVIVVVRSAAGPTDPDADQALAGVVASAIEPRREVAEAARRARAAEDTLRTVLTRYAGLQKDAQTFTHDARVLVGIVIGFGCNLRDGIAGPLQPAQAQHVARILEAAGDTSSLLERYAVAAREEALEPRERAHSLAPHGRTSARRTLQNLAGLARGTLRLFEEVAGEKDIAIALTEDDAVSLWCDAMQMKQVVTNLIVNAIKFTPRGGRISVRLRVAQGSQAAAGAAARRQAELTVSDSGPGIDPSDRARVFERGVRLERDKERGIPGTGVGLAVVHEIVQLHGGVVRIEDAAPAPGAAFVVTLPLDMRTRAERGIVALDDEEAAARIITAVRAIALDGRGSVEALARALEGCAQVLVVPPGGRARLQQALVSADLPKLPSVPPDSLAPTTPRRPA
jgi:signal transduction histidine kinase